MKEVFPPTMEKELQQQMERARRAHREATAANLVAQENIHNDLVYHICWSIRTTFDGLGHFVRRVV